jgi:hypothetical protein
MVTMVRYIAKRVFLFSGMFVSFPTI